MTLNRRAFIAASGALATNALWGCSPKAGHDGIRFVIRTGLEASGLRADAEHFTNDTGIAVDINELGRDGYLSSVPTQLLTGSSDADVIFAPSTLVAELAAARSISSLDSVVDAKDTDLITRSTYAGSVYGIPTDISSMFLYYRSDLIESPPQTWHEYLEVAKRFTRELNPDSPTRYGAAIPGESGEDLPKGFYNVLWSFGGDVIRDGVVMIDSPQSLEAARYYASLVAARVLSPDITSWGFSQMFEGLLNHTVAMAGPFWNAAAPLIAQSKSDLKSKIAYTLVPGVEQVDRSILRVPFQHSWTLVLNAASKKAIDTRRFIAFTTGPEGARRYALKGGNPGRYSILRDAALLAVRPDFAVLERSLRLARAEPSVPYYAAVHKIMNEALTKILARTSSPEDATATAATRLKAITSQSVPRAA
jgi:ABC-type glycerol-3-phosphate transport system substrate-binding protein